MALPLFKEQRISVRKTLTGLLPGRLVTVDGKDIECQPKDVSKNGIGISSQMELAVGTILVLKLKQRSVMLEIVWSQPGFGKRDMTRYGLMTKDPMVDLERAFVEAGCLV